MAGSEAPRRLSRPQSRPLEEGGCVHRKKCEIDFGRRPKHPRFFAARRTVTPDFDQRLVADYVGRREDAPPSMMKPDPVLLLTVPGSQGAQ